MPSMLPVAGRRSGSAAQLQSRGMLLKPQVGGECLLWPARQIMSAISLAALPDRIQSHPPNQVDDIPAPAKICETYARKRHNQKPRRCAGSALRLHRGPIRLV